MKSRLIVAIASFFFLYKAEAVNAGEVTRYTPNQVATFFAGAIDMYIHTFPKRAACVKDWFYTRKGSVSTYALFERNPRKSAAAIMGFILDRKCGGT